MPKWGENEHNCVHNSYAKMHGYCISKLTGKQKLSFAGCGKLAITHDQRIDK